MCGSRPQDDVGDPLPFDQLPEQWDATQVICQIRVPTSVHKLPFLMNVTRSCFKNHAHPTLVSKAREFCTDSHSSSQRTDIVKIETSLLHTATMSNSPPFTIPDWKAAAANKRQELFDNIPKTHRLHADLAQRAANNDLLPEDPSIFESGIFNDLDIEITSILDAQILLQRIEGRQYTAVQVAEAFCKRASIAQQCTGCLTELMYESAMKRARFLDDYLEKNKKTVGILHGLPVSLKVRDCFNTRQKR